MEGLSGNLPAGVYDLQTREFRHIIFGTGGIGCLTINPTEGVKDFFLGNLIVCGQPDVKVAAVSSGQGEAEIAVRNPTDADTKAW